MLIAAALLLAAPEVQIPQGAALTAAIDEADKNFFELFFTGCDPAAARRMVTDDFEMYHDKGGLVASTGDAFIAEYADSCEKRKAPDAWRSRRELIRETLKVTPIPGYGAIEEGSHWFYERKGDGPEKKVGYSRFSQVWKLDNGTWKIARVISIDHRAARPGE